MLYCNHATSFDDIIILTHDNKFLQDAFKESLLMMRNFLIVNIVSIIFFIFAPLEWALRPLYHS